MEEAQHDVSTDKSFTLDNTKEQYCNLTTSGLTTYRVKAVRETARYI